MPDPQEPPVDDPVRSALEDLLKATAAHDLLADDPRWRSLQPAWLKAYRAWVVPPDPKAEPQSAAERKGRPLSPDTFRLENWNGSAWEASHASHQSMTAKFWAGIAPSVRNWTSPWRLLRLSASVEETGLVSPSGQQPVSSGRLCGQTPDNLQKDTSPC